MLIQFSFKNFNSFRDEATLDLSAAKMTEFSDRVVAVGGEKLLLTAAIYGANASGKSNVYSAFEYMTKYVINSFKYGDEVKVLKRSVHVHFCLTRALLKRIRPSKSILLYPGIKQRRAIITVFVLAKKALLKSG